MHPATSFDKGAMPVLRKAIQFTQARHTLIANNIANAETPGYMSRDIDEAGFTEQLRRAIDERRAGNPRLWNFEGNRDIRQRRDGTTRFATLPTADGGVDTMQHSQNNVDIDKEMVKLAKNTILHNTAIQLLQKQYAMLSTAIAERVSP